jgi:hypothetical protein
VHCVWEVAKKKEEEDIVRKIGKTTLQASSGSIL